MSVTRTPPEHAAVNATTDADHDIPLQVARQLEQQIAEGRNRRAKTQRHRKLCRPIRIITGDARKSTIAK